MRSRRFYNLHMPYMHLTAFLTVITAPTLLTFPQDLLPSIGAFFTISCIGLMCNRLLIVITSPTILTSPPSHPWSSLTHFLPLLSFFYFISPGFFISFYFYSWFPLPSSRLPYFHPDFLVSCTFLHHLLSRTRKPNLAYFFCFFYHLAVHMITLPSRFQHLTVPLFSLSLSRKILYHFSPQSSSSLRGPSGFLGLGFLFPSRDLAPDSFHRAESFLNFRIRFILRIEISSEHARAIFSCSPMYPPFR